MMFISKVKLMSVNSVLNNMNKPPVMSFWRHNLFKAALFYHERMGMLDCVQFNQSYVTYSRNGKLVGALIGMCIASLIVFAIAIGLYSNQIAHFGISTLLKHITVYNSLIWASSAFFTALVSVFVATCIYVHNNKSIREHTLSFFFRNNIAKSIPLVTYIVLTSIFIVFIALRFSHTNTMSFIHTIGHFSYMHIMLYVILFIVCSILFFIVKVCYDYNSARKFYQYLKLYFADVISDKSVEEEIGMISDATSSDYDNISVDGTSISSELEQPLLDDSIYYSADNMSTGTADTLTKYVLCNDSISCQTSEDDATPVGQDIDITCNQLASVLGIKVLINDDILLTIITHILYVCQEFYNQRDLITERYYKDIYHAFDKYVSIEECDNGHIIGLKRFLRQMLNTYDTQMKATTKMCDKPFLQLGQFLIGMMEKFMPIVVEAGYTDFLISVVFEKISSILILLDDTFLVYLSKLMNIDDMGDKDYCKVQYHNFRILVEKSQWLMSKPYGSITVCFDVLHSTIVSLSDLLNQYRVLKCLD